jgi:hypothetical protein
MSADAALWYGVYGLLIAALIVLILSATRDWWRYK